MFSEVTREIPKPLRVLPDQKKFTYDAKKVKEHGTVR